MNSCVLTLCAVLSAIKADIFDPTAVANETEYYEYTFNLTRKLFNNYDTERIPVRNASKAIKVHFFLGIYHIEGIDELQQTMTVHGFLSMYWKDEFLNWSKAEFNGQDTVDVPLHRIWKPDVNLYNSASGKDDWLLSRVYPARVYSSGQVLMWPPVTFKVSCHFDFTDYPNDVQTCPIVLGSYKYVKETAEYNWAPTKPLVSLSYGNKKQHISGWEIVSVTNNKYFWNQNNRTTTASDSLNFVEMMAFVKLQRHQPYFGPLMVLPALGCSALTIFALKKESGEISLLILLMVLMVQGIFARDLMIELPVGRATSRVVKYFGFNLSMTLIGIILSAVRMALAQCTTNVSTKVLFVVRLMLSFNTTIATKLRILRAKQRQPLIPEEETNATESEVQTMNEADPMKLDNIEHWQQIAKCFQLTVTILFGFMYFVAALTLFGQF